MDILHTFFIDDIANIIDGYSNEYDEHRESVIKQLKHKQKIFRKRYGEKTLRNYIKYCTWKPKRPVDDNVMKFLRSEPYWFSNQSRYYDTDDDVDGVPYDPDLFLMRYGDEYIPIERCLMSQIRFYGRKYI